MGSSGGMGRGRSRRFGGGGARGREVSAARGQPLVMVVEHIRRPHLKPAGAIEGVRRASLQRCEPKRECLGCGGVLQSLQESPSDPPPLERRGHIEMVQIKMIRAPAHQTGAGAYQGRRKRPDAFRLGGIASTREFCNKAVLGLKRQARYVRAVYRIKEIKTRFGYLSNLSHYHQVFKCIRECMQLSLHFPGSSGILKAPPGPRTPIRVTRVISSSKLPSATAQVPLASISRSIVAPSCEKESTVCAELLLLRKYWMSIFALADGASADAGICEVQLQLPIRRSSIFSSSDLHPASKRTDMAKMTSQLPLIISSIEADPHVSSPHTVSDVMPIKGDACQVGYHDVGVADCHVLANQIPAAIRRGRAF
ncbi:hypothetical protein AKL17_3506 [Frigidibacter mobilis]|uniref:Uncharacterized protein n=1 Tax=Frigidibacter mobilis TaxID=1335048 RepID=A0A159Z7Z0_9RHOB|nr:hypothetical protein AKL17_3506 [Frigidibacter mobilis]